MAYFTDARINLKPREPFATRLVREVQGEFPRLLGLKILTLAPGATGPRTSG
jgi:hypothetical protein